MAADETPSAAEVQEYLKGVSYPASADEVRNKAKENGAEEDERVMHFFEHLPEGEYSGPQEVSMEIGNYQEEDMDEAG